VNLQSFVQPAEEGGAMVWIIAQQKCSFYVIDADIVVVTKIIMDSLLMPFKQGGQAMLDHDKDKEDVTILTKGDGDGIDEPTRSEDMMTQHYATTEKRRILKMFVYTAVDDVL
jgi:hypothetical protein